MTLLLTLLVLAPSGETAYGMHRMRWAPVTHVFLADFALNDACDDGRLTISRVDGDSIVGTVGDYRVDAEVRASICAFPEYFRAGVVGPDAFPDVLTGQRKIHPMLSRAVTTLWQAGLVQPDGESAAGTDAWLSHLWLAAFPPANRRGAADVGPSAWKAFVVGFLAHAAGDMFGHSYVNYWSGGPFELTSDNAVKHLLIEAYIGTRTPRPGTGVLPTTTSAIRDRLYRTMTRADRSTVLDEKLLVRESLEASLPRHFSDIRQELMEYLIAYQQTDDIFASVLGAPLDYYLRAWIQDIDAGLLAWSGVSLEVARALFFGSEYPNASVGNAIGHFTTDHLLSMLSYPDVVGDATGVAVDVFDALVPDAIGEMAQDLGEWTFEHAFGMSYREYVDLVTNPRRYFDNVMSIAPSGNRITVQEFTTDELGMSVTDQWFVPERFPPAYNTVVMTKLLMMDQGEVNRLLLNLGGQARLRTPNVMLGFVTSLDTDNQWQDGIQMVFAREQGVYPQVFMDQRGVQGGVSLAGVVTDEKSGDPLEGVLVEIAEPGTVRVVSRQAVTGADGRYELPWVPVGADPRIRFTDPAAKYGDEWWRDTTPNAAIPVRVTAGDTLITGIDAALALKPPSPRSSPGAGPGGPQTVPGPGTPNPPGGPPVAPPPTPPGSPASLTPASSSCGFTVSVDSGGAVSHAGDRVLFARSGQGAQLMLQDLNRGGVLTVSLSSAPPPGQAGRAPVEAGGGTLGVPQGVVYEFSGAGSLTIEEDQGGRFRARGSWPVKVLDGRQNPAVTRGGRLTFSLISTNRGPVDFSGMINGATCIVGQ